MNFALKAIAGLVISFAAAQAKADSVVQCSDAKVKNGPVILQYIISGAKSARLASPITWNGVTYPSSNVAQYQTTSINLYFLLDDGAGTPTVGFLAALPSTKTFPGAVSTYNSAGKVSSTKAVSCKLISL